MRWAHPTVAVAVVGLSAALSAQDAEKDFEKSFGPEARQVAASRDTKDDAAFAAELLAAAKSAKTPPALRALLCRKAYAFGIKDPAGHGTAIEAMGLLAEADPGAADECGRKRLAVLQLRFHASKGRHKTKAAEALLNEVLAICDRRVAAGKATDAMPLYRRAMALVALLQSPRKPEVQTRIKSATARAALEQKLRTLAAELKAAPGSAKARTALIRLYLVEFDSPAEAARLLDEGVDEALRTRVRLALRPIKKVPEAACLPLGRWYQSLAPGASPLGQARVLGRARTYYQRYLQLHAKPDDVEAFKARVLLGRAVKASADLAAATTPPVPRDKWIPLLTNPKTLVGWDVPDAEEDSGVKYAKGLILLTGEFEITYPLEAGDIVVRTGVRKLAGTNLVLQLRKTPKGYYRLWFGENAEKEPTFGIDRVETPAGKDPKTETLESASPEQSCSGALELRFSAIGQTLTVHVGREKVVQVQDDHFGAGALGIGVSGEGKSLFKDVQILIPGPRE